MPHDHPPRPPAGPPSEGTDGHRTVPSRSEQSGGAEPTTASDAAPVAPSRDFGLGGPIRKQGYLSPGARKEKLRQRHYSQPRHRAPHHHHYAELHAASSFSFLEGASLPEDLVERAAELGIEAVALVDRNGVYGAPRFYKAAREAGLRALVGAEVVVEGEPFVGSTLAALRHALPKDRIDEVPTDLLETRLTLLVESGRGYRNLCRLLTAGALRHLKREARVDWDILEAHAAGLHCLVGLDGDSLGQTLRHEGPQSSRRLLEQLRAAFPERLHLELQRHGCRHQERRNRILVELSRSLRLPLVATNGVRYARERDKELFDVMTCIRHHTQLDAAGALLAAQRQHHFRSVEEMAALFADLPQALHGSRELAERLDFTLADLGYRFPEYPLPHGETAMSFLRKLTWNGARARFRPLTSKAQAQIAKELRMIEKLDLAGYFLIVWDIVRFCLEEKILAQGRGSAANSAVCYALSITAVDPVKMELLFERFLSEERGEWPDIDLDLPSGGQREKVIQYVYRRYGAHGAAMTANVITYRDRMAAREVAKALGYAPDQVDRLAKRLGSWHYDAKRGDPKAMDEELRACGFDPEDSRIQLFARMWRAIQNHPRHLGQHSGGMVLCAGRLDEIVPLEPAAMEGRVVVQWDKDDCADLGLIKVDLLGLGMLNALEEAVPLIRTHERKNLDLAHLPPDDPKVYRMLQEADTVGVFQVESRAQMASLPRHRPEKFYDLVIQIAIIRPGPIVGRMAHPFFERRLGREEVTYPHPSLEPILKRTLGVPIFQEQILKIAMTAAGFTGGEAEELRRAMGFKRSMERMERIEERLRRGMAERGISPEAQEQIVQAITSFALYGFPESHSASFALIAYASAYIKAHHPTAFVISLLNAWPMGFYHPASLVKDAQRHGVEVLPIDVNRSGWRCRWEAAAYEGDEHGERTVRKRRQKPCTGKARPAGAARLGLRFVKGLRRETGERIEAEQERRPFADIEDLVHRCRLQETEATSLAELGALARLESDRDKGSHSRRSALWQVARAVRPEGALFVGHDTHEPSPLPEMSPMEETAADYRFSEITTGPHPMTYYRSALARLGVVPAAELPRQRADARVRAAGSVIVRQRPGTAKGLLFLTLEDETGMCQAVVMPDVFKKHRSTIVAAAGLMVEGVLQMRDGSLSVKADRFWPLERLEPVPSHDFR